VARRQVIQELLVPLEFLEPQVDIPEHREHPVGNKGRAPRRWPRWNHLNPKY
jgi:hypothetical protein